MDEEHRLPFIEAIDWAHDHAVGVFAVMTRFSDNMSHGTILLRLRVEASSTPLMQNEVLSPDKEVKRISEFPNSPVDV